MAAEPIIELILEHLAPDLSLVPDWAPAPDPPVPLGPLGQKLHWSDVYDFVSNAISKLFTGGTAINIPTTQDVQNYVNGAVGEAIKAMSGFIDQNAAMTVQAASLLEGAINNVVSNELNDFKNLSSQITDLQNGLAFVGQIALPTILNDIAAARVEARQEALAAQLGAQDWALHKIFAPLYAEMLKVQPAIDAGVAQAEAVAHSDAAAQVAKLAGEVGVTVGPIRAAVAALQTESEDCTQPMCETLGPKTDLGKLLKALKFAADAAFLAELYNLTEPELVGYIKKVVAAMANVVTDFESFFGSGGETVGHLIASATGA